MNEEKRFAGRMSDEYRLVEKAYPHFEELQEAIGDAVASFQNPDGDGVYLLEIGCGDGITSDVILRARQDVHLTAIDNESKMVTQIRENLRDEIADGRVEVVEADALEFLKKAPEASFDIVSSALTLHNFHHAFRFDILGASFRVLKPGGLFVNADKYAPEGQARFDALITQLGRFFDTFLPLEKYDLLKDWVLHQVTDQSPDRVMTEVQARQEMERLGFVDIRVSHRHGMEAVLSARKQG